ncbi:MAG: aminoacetone oxidase family FAD-binding enzyme [Halobacteriovoraceae bacterium]|nr:aminoacetone oxidase family FAD-binding enzyme [Halobacteriovoraceae bacterium]
MEKVIIVGGGPAGLFCAFKLLERGYSVELYEQTTAVGKKFLVAGNGGLNLTHSEDLEPFSKRYGQCSRLFYELLQEFGPKDLRSFFSELGVETFVGTSGRVFPKNIKASEILKRWVDKLKADKNFKLFARHSLIEIREEQLIFKSKGELIEVPFEKAILGLGGASWKRTGSDGKWKQLLEKLGVEIKEFLPMNCGFETKWSTFFIESVDRAPLKNVGISFQNHRLRGELMLTPFGLEGGGIYAISNFIREEILLNGSAEIHLDLKPDLDLDEVKKRLIKRGKKTSMSNHLRKSLGISKNHNILLKELVAKEDYNNPEQLALNIKSLKVVLQTTRPIEEAISTSGGVALSEVNANFQLKKLPGVYVIGEMLDFEAPTGGYLLQASFSTAWRALGSFKKGF